ncbi:MAG: sodium/proline symporter, partial [Thermodesulfobacteria bacterium]|nr:sodium/proline symporter [Thermodesulfobacteriota bacterium]
FSQTFSNSITLPEYLENRFGDDSGLLRSLSALMILFFFTLYTSSGLVAGGKLFNSIFHVPYETAMLLGAGSVLVYTFMGGFLAVSWTDAFQATLMLMALLIVPALAFGEIGSVDPSGGSLGKLLSTFLPNEQGLAAVGTIVSLCAWGLGYFGQPHILARFMAIDSQESIPRARQIGTSWAALAMMGAILAGLAGRLYFADGLEDGEKVFIFLVQELMHPAIAGICLAGILAAIMSTADSQLLVSASALAEDFYRARIRPGAGQRELVWAGRLTVLMVCLAAMFLAQDPNSKVLDMVSYAWAGFGAGFGPTLILSLFWRDMNRLGALAGIASGCICVVVWKNLHGGIFDIYEMLPGFVVSTVAIIVASKMGKKPEREQLALFDKSLGLLGRTQSFKG